MKLDTAWETVPDDDDLMWSIEHWDTDKIGSRESRHSDMEIEAFVHPSTATGVRIMEHDDGSFSVQPSTGDYDNGDCVVQSDDPTTLVGGGSSVVATGIETLSEARAMAFTWLQGWVMRNSSIKGEGHPREGDVGDATGDPRFEPIQ